MRIIQDFRDGFTQKYDKIFTFRDAGLGLAYTVRMLTSTEIRWFFEGLPPAEVEQWFCRGDMQCKAPLREDHYLVFPASTSVGVKSREGRLEIKSLIKTLGVRRFGADAAGNVQMWEKWSCVEFSATDFEQLLRCDASLWVTVAKERTLRKFSLEGDSPAEVQAGQVFSHEGCNVELTKITVQGAAHWSFNCEAYGEPSRIEGYLHRVAERFLADERRPRTFKTGAAGADAFSAPNSFSYPEWLGRLAKKR